MAEPYTIFISYAHEDERFKDQLVQHLAGINRQRLVASWDDRRIEGGDAWFEKINEAIDRCDLALLLVSPAFIASGFINAEELPRLIERHAREGIRVVPVIVRSCAWNLEFVAQLQAWPKDGKPIASFSETDDSRDQAWTAIVREIAGLAIEHHGGGSAAVAESGDHRQTLTPAKRSAYLARLGREVALYRQRYTPLAGEAQINPARSADPGGLMEMHPEFELLRALRKNDSAQEKPRRFEDAAEAFGALTQAVVLGEPGQGKTTTLLKMASNLMPAAAADANAPLPVFARLGLWTEAEESLWRFLSRQLDIGESAVDALLVQGKLILLLDGLNEIPVEQRERKATEIRELLDSGPSMRILVSCRLQDYRDALSFDRDTLTIRPLDAPRILAFLTAHLTHSMPSKIEDASERAALGHARAHDLFWKIAGGSKVKSVFETWRQMGADLQMFFSAPDIPQENSAAFLVAYGAQYDLWREIVNDPRNLMRVASNPYILAMLVAVYEPESGDFPQNRAALFDRFVSILLVREHLAERKKHGSVTVVSEEGHRLLQGLEAVAWAMQAFPAARSDSGLKARTALPRNAVEIFFAPPLFDRAVGASLLERGDAVRFTHQLLQEYFAARGLRAQIEDRKLRAELLWPSDRWWETSGWEETAVLLAGLYEHDCTPALEWLGDANPEVAARCACESGARIPGETLQRLRGEWVPRLSDLAREPRPEARAAVGRALGMLKMDGLPLDDRRGIGVWRDPGKGLLLPDIDWCEVPAGEFQYGDECKTRKLAAYRIARYALTNAQFQCFIDDKGYDTDTWWQGLQRQEPKRISWDLANHPRETVSWYEAMAFCKWLTTRLRAVRKLGKEEELRLPTEQEWEKAARGTDGREYPWGKGYQAGRANINETSKKAGLHNLQRTSAVGIYPQGESPCGALDMAGNVWEWCLDKYHEKDFRDDAPRALRGGSWYDGRDLARCASRARYNPDGRNDDIGFRLCCSPSIK